MSEISIQADDFSVEHEINALRAQSTQIGAVASFVGLVRDVNDGDSVSTLFLEHYPGMTEKSLTTIVTEAKQRWPLIGVKVIHRIGLLHITDQIVFVGVSSAHRKAAFAACEFIMDYLKTKAPFWKKEAVGGGTRWVETKDSDETALDKWK